MKHLGDITKLDGHNVPLVDIVTGGSPCQDLSVAGKRAGLAGERSGLFMEQIRIIKEMRDESAKQLRLRGSDEYIRPRYMVWENVPGAFSSNHGEDFRAVLEETAKVCDKNTIIPRPEGGRWSPSGCIMGDGWSIAWRVHDAQFWGVPQRRKRIALVADFGGDTAPEILFESKGLSGDSETSREEGQEVAGAAGENSSETISFQERAGKPGGGKGILIQHERTGALSTLNNQSVLSIDEKMGQTYIGDNVGNTLGARDYKQPQAVAYTTQACGDRDDPSQSYQENLAYTVPSNPMSDRGQAVVCGSPVATKVYCLQGNGIDRADTAGCNGKGWREDQCYTLNTIDRPAVCKTYQQTTGALTPGAHPGSYNGQDAYNDMLVVDKSPKTGGGY